MDTSKRDPNSLGPQRAGLIGLLLGAALLGLLVVWSNFPLFHCVVELGSAAVAACIAMIAWNTRALRRDGYQLFLGIGLGAVSLLLVLHALSHESMGALALTRSQASCQLGMLSRLWLAGVLLLAPWFTRRDLSVSATVTVTAMLWVALGGLAVHTSVLPTCAPHLEESTLQSRGVEGVILLLLLGAVWTHWRARDRLHSRLLGAIVGAIVLAAATELCLTLQHHEGDPLSAAGHLAQLLVFVLLYWGLVRMSLAEPYTLMFHQLIRSLEALEQEANRDELTGLYNRRGLVVLGEAQLALSRRLGLKTSVIFADLNGLKRLNDEHGHSWGDQALIDTATLLRRTFREADVVSRVGGDEFVVLLTHGNGIQPLQRLRAAIQAFSSEAERPYTLSVALGRAMVAPGSTLSLDEILEEADSEMYTDKQEHYAKIGGEPRS